MALGFGFNKAKTLGAAEKYVQQGKLQNAIAEYDKVAKQDPKDLTVLNTIGDLYARLGRADQATENFRKVGDAYAADGFVVKAIAMYKKLTKLNPSALDSVVRLAELYTQQGLYNDARAQYTAVADQYLKNNDREKATGILKKMLDLDPDNAAMQTKVADLYLKLGKNQEALEIYFNSAQSLYQRGAADSAQEPLERVLKLNANFAPALLLRGQMAMEDGDGARAIESLSKLPDLDKRPEALRPLLQAYVQTGKFEQADPIAAKLVDVHNDLSAISLYADALFSADKPDQALGVYERNADKLLAGNKQVLIDALTASIPKARDNAPALQSMLRLLQKAGATGHAPREVQESLAHACAQSGELQKAADLYRALAEAEPENPLHDQNYRQIISRMGKDAVTRELSVEEGGQALMVDELEAAPAVMQEYPREIAEAINSALTDSELFSSYNVPEKAITPLERVLPKAPNDVRLRQRLASLYARVERFADAANSCGILADIHAGAGLTDQALQYREMAGKYNEQAGGVAASAPVIAVPASRPEAKVVPAEELAPFKASSVAEFSIEAPAQPQSSVAEFDLSSVPADSSVAFPEALPPAEAQHGNEWEDMLTVEEPTAERAAAESTSQLADEGQVQEITAEETPDEILEEARFYLSQGMTTEAHSAISRLQQVAPDHPALEELRLAAATAQVAAAPEVEVAPSEAARPVEEAQAPVTELELQPSAPSLEPESIAAPEIDIAPIPPVAEEVSVREPEPVSEVTVETEATLGPIEEEQPAVAMQETDVLGDLAGEEESEVALAPENPLAGMVSDLEDALGDIAPVSAAKSPVPTQRPMAAAASLKSVQLPVAAPPQISAQAQVEANSMLSGLLDEFKEEIEEPSEDGDDPDTHYNLGVAFREMGLLDEAIGELQKVCRAVDSGKPFSQPIQAYTWLAQCLVDKGAAQAAIRWYERALRVQGISEDSRLAVYYDMANAFESAGDKKAALDNFMEVYGSNIDYRDVADRIRSLRK
jgi:pilus assembly protein FimV